MAKGGSASSGAGSSGGRRSWRPSSANTRQARQEKVAGKWLLAVLAVVLIALLIYVARGERLARTYVVTVTSGVPEALVVPPIALAAEDSAQLRDTPHAAAVEWDEQELGALARQWSQWKLEPQDAVLVYVNAHGISDDGQAYLLQNDFMHWTDVGRAEAGRVPVAKLLDQFRDCPAGVRLLVLDCGRLASDPRLGMLVNEFPRLVAEQVKESSDANLWVLLANSTGETTLAQPSVGDSPFAAALADGLRGAASLPDKSGKVDRLVTLDELYRYLLLRLEDDLSSVVGARHTPLLLRGGAGLIQPGQVPTGIVLARIDAAKAAADGASPAAAPPPDDKSSKTDKSALNISRTPHRLGFARSLPAGLFHSLSVAQAGGDASAAQKPQANPGSKENQSAGEKTPSEKTPSETSSSNKPQGEKPASDKPASEKPPGDKAQGEKSTDGSADAGKDKGKDGGKESGKDGDARSASKPTSEPAGEPTKRDERSAAQIALDAAWRIRDKLRDRANPEAWSPADFAPHLWRELDALLVDYEQRLRAGRAFHESELAAPLELLARELQTLDDALQQPTRAASAPSTESASVGVRMLAAWKRFQDDPRGRAAFRAGGRTLEEVRRALRLRADSLHAAADFVRWHDRASRRAASADALPLTSELVAWLRELNSQGRQLAAMEGQPIDASSAQQLTQLDDQIVRRRAALEKLLRDEARLIVDRAQAARRAPAPAPAKTSSTADELTAPIDDLLATALLPANDRQALAEVLKAMSSAAPPSSESASSESASSTSGNDDDGTKATAVRKRPALATRDLDRRLAGLASRKVTLSPTARQWAVIAAQVDLELQLVGLVDPETAATLQPLVAEISDAAEQPSGAREEQLFAKLREAGRQFRDFYSQIPSTVLRADSNAAGSRGAAGGASSGGPSGATAANSPTAGVKSSWLLHLIDARDSREADRLLAERKSLPALRLLVRGPRLTPMLAVTPARGDVELDQGGWRPVTLPVAGVLQRPAASLVGNVKFNPQQVKVRLAGGSTELTSGAPFDIAVASNAEG
ncbi:MAG TPA: hypothetical protein PLV92_01775, partial [Pirellulaceae bacterium]|nr:hypothetical protein [Pirellulaceae bacterium]